jgi:small subunit ribosomal protein S8
MTDPIADMLTRIRNAVQARKDEVEIPASRIKTSIAKIMKEEGFIKNYKVLKNSPKVKNGLGVAILSTSRGILTDRQCRKEKVGGEVLCSIW